ncbi:hypothetical protein CAEBREN_13378 [Caenorhabditis brenneri]|uniref:T20D4.11-like domain-containing protein n=1 Tax=Caenorhabditis brenneri TaxID=135651 RepID=G0NF15_CAEBE|nr:hypothetical protein CAEBREN_13378 [Caenorhabditis brenneri]
MQFAYNSHESNVHHCLRDYDFLDYNSTKRREGYNNGKSCLIDFMSDNCTPAASKYFVEKYQLLSNVMSAELAGRDCFHSFYHSNGIYCRALIDELPYRRTLYSNNNVQLDDSLRDSTEKLCTATKTCFSSSDCPTSHDYKLFYEAKCQNLEFQKVDLHECLTIVYSLIYNGFYECIGKYNFLSTDLNLKKESFDSGKFCFLQMVTNKCSSESSEFINNNYEKVVDMLTVKPVGETCAEPFHEFQSQQCQAAVDSAKSKMKESFGNETPSIFNEKWSQIEDVCQKAQDCIDDCCQYNERDRETINNLCASLKISSNKLGECLRKLNSEKTDLTKYSCLNGTELYGAVLQNTCLLFGTMKDCTKTVLEDFCGSAVISDNEKSISALLALSGCK